MWLEPNTKQTRSTEVWARPNDDEACTCSTKICVSITKSMMLMVFLQFSSPTSTNTNRHNTANPDTHTHYIRHHPHKRVYEISRGRIIFSSDAQGHQPHHHNFVGYTWRPQEFQEQPSCRRRRRNLNAYNHMTNNIYTLFHAQPTTLRDSRWFWWLCLDKIVGSLGFDLILWWSLIIPISIVIIINCEMRPVLFWSSGNIWFNLM